MLEQIDRRPNRKRCGLKFDTPINKSCVPLNITKEKAHIDPHQLRLESRGVLRKKSRVAAAEWIVGIRYSTAGSHGSQAEEPKQAGSCRTLPASVKWCLLESWGFTVCFLQLKSSLCFSLVRKRKKKHGRECQPWAEEALAYLAVCSGFVFRETCEVHKNRSYAANVVWGAGKLFPRQHLSSLPCDA